MAFKSIKEYTPYYSKMDPRVDSTFAINSNYMVMAVTHYKTYNEMLRSNKTIADMKVIGLVNDHQVTEATDVASFFEIGNKRQIHIPGKTAGRLGLSSQIIESVNLLGGIYETIIDGMKNDPSMGKAMTNFEKNVLYRPQVNQVYSEGSDKGSSYDIDSVNTNINDPLSQFYVYGNEQAMAVKAQAEEQKGKETNKGALLFSISDLRMKIKFGLAFLIFQTSKRLLYNMPYNKSGQEFLTNSDFPQISNYDDTRIAQRTYDIEDEYDYGDHPTESYKILGGVFFENCLLTDYSRVINTDAVGPNYMESINVLFNGTHNLQPSKLSSDPDVNVTPINFS